MIKISDINAKNIFFVDFFSIIVSYSIYSKRRRVCSRRLRSTHSLWEVLKVLSVGLAPLFFGGISPLCSDSLILCLSIQFLLLRCCGVSFHFFFIRSPFECLISLNNNTRFPKIVKKLPALEIQIFKAGFTDFWSKLLQLKLKNNWVCFSTLQ